MTTDTIEANLFKNYPIAWSIRN